MSTRIYYTGDICNQSGWFTTEDALAPAMAVVTLTEDESEWSEGRKFTLHAGQIGHVYAGHCNPRFVTEAAYRSYMAEQAAKYAPASVWA